MNSGPYSKLWTHINKHPNPATEALPVSMLFRDDMKSTFPKPALNQKNTQEARERDRKLKDSEKYKINLSKYRAHNKFQIQIEFLQET